MTLAKKQGIMRGHGGLTRNFLQQQANRGMNYVHP